MPRSAIALCVLARCICAQQIAVRVCNSSPADVRDIAEMKRTAETIFQHSGLGIRWLECAAAAIHTGTLELTVNTAKPGNSQALGCATLGDSRMSVFFTPATDVSAGKGVRLRAGEIMGHLLAHEMGHLLLRTRDHALHGIMKGPYRQQDLVRMSQGTLFFTAEETASLRSTVTAVQEPEVSLAAMPAR